MSLNSTFRHNQTTFVSALLALIVAGGIFGCHLLEQPDKTPAQTAGEIAAAASTAAPPPLKEILIVISSLLGSGIFVDNRRKDSVIKVLQKENGINAEIISNNLKLTPPHTARKG